LWFPLLIWWTPLCLIRQILTRRFRLYAYMEADAAAICEAISSRWSNGVVEGHVNRLKMLKRQMYGRAGFELLRQRVMSPLA
ncbi:TPA: transposase, partial [Escherichia coli]